MSEKGSEKLKGNGNDVPLCIDGASSTRVPNGEIILFDNRQITITPKSDDSTAVEVKGKVLYHFQPIPRLIIKINSVLEKSFDYFNEEEILVAKVNGLVLNCRVTNIRTKNFEESEVTLSSIDGKATGEGVKGIMYATFDLVNFPLCLGKGIRGRNNSNYFWKGRLEFGDIDWRITIDKLENHKNLREKLANEGGFAITHSGKILKKSRQAFSSIELEDLRKVIFEFLSFARGARAAPIYFKGRNEDDEVIWEDWSFPRVDRWILTQDNWFAVQHAFEQLHELFPGWSKLLNHSLWQKEIPKIIYWYSYAGRNTDGAGTDGSLILAVAALELFSFNYLVRYKQIRNESKFKSKNLHNNVYKTLNELEIPTEIPDELSNLFQYALQKNWQNGPKACVETRNEVVHPDRNSEPGSLNCYDALQLSLWYLEMMILRMCEYEDIYSNRLDRPKWKGTVEKVTWASNN